MHNEAIRQRACELFKEGLSYRAVAQTLNLPPYTVREWFYLFERENAQDSLLTLEEQRSQAYELFAQGLGYRAASKALNLNAYTVRSWHRTYLRLLEKGQLPAQPLQASEPQLYPQSQQSIFQHFLTQAAFRDNGKGEAILTALSDIVSMVGFEKVAKALDLSEEELKTTLAHSETVSFEFIFRLLKVLDLHL